LAALLAALPVVCASIIHLQVSAATKDQLNAETTDDGNGILATRISTPQGTITVNLPNDLSCSDTISGTVIAEPTGETPEVQKKHTDEIGGYVVEIQKAEEPPEETIAQAEPPQTPPTTEGPPQTSFEPPPGGCTTDVHIKHKAKPPKKSSKPPKQGTCSPPATIGCTSPAQQMTPPPKSCTPAKKPPTKTSCVPKKIHHKGPAVIQATPKNPGFVCGIPTNSKGITIVVKDPTGKIVVKQPIAVNPTPPPCSCSPGTVMLPTVGTAGRPVRIKASTSGNTKTGLVKIGGQPCIPLAKSPRQVVVNTPQGCTGRSTIEYQEGNSVAKGQFNNLELNVSCQKTTLDKGESSTIVINVSGMQGMKGPVKMRITNLNPGTVTLSGGNQQSFVINPSR